MTNGQTELWVVYQTPIRFKPGTLNAVCPQSEWEALMLSRPGYYTLVRGGITNEGEAEILARTSAPVAAKNSELGEPVVAGTLQRGKI